MDKAGMSYTKFSLTRQDGVKLEYNLCFDYNELCDAERDCGLNLGIVLDRLDASTAGQLRGLLKAMLKNGHPQINLEQCGDILSTDYFRVRSAMAIELQEAMHLEQIEIAKALDPQPPAAPEVKQAPDAPAPAPTEPQG